ncbi:hypothetical protein TESG_02199 [Trichophyton tonsurans CBS 112818]|uniref:thioredoxin-dependent peroxiredoxin n=2 Tax=Trichophyton TaxID=5550 RepID=F2PNZ1_TRIEC|nr:hypothetical protein TESG_02199 [Trichophyton tonsurans CBS 112818]EGE03609.1 AhpC/TSA family protein [Trichophyton equinum CBS 127.97]
MAPELRKRKAPAPAPVAEPKAKRGSKAGAKAEPKKAAPKEKKAAAAAAAAAPPAAEPEKADKKEEKKEKKEEKKEEEIEEKKEAKGEEETGEKAAGGVPEEGDVLDLSQFEAEIELNDGTKTSFRKLLEESKEGVAVFTYPKASTPGCTRQACAFRDDYANLTSTGLSIFGLSGDSPKANTTFQTKQKLPYPLLCDPSFTLIGAFGLKKTPKGTVRGVFAVNKEGKVLLRTPGGPEKTLSLVQDLVKGK